MNKLAPKLPSVALLVGLALALSACSNDNPPTTEQPTVTVINGHMQTWSGAGTVSAPGLPGTAATVAADGHFNLTLPDAQAMSGHVVAATDMLAGLQCKGSLSSSNPAVKGFGVAVLSAQDAAGSREVFAASASGNLLAGFTVEAQAWVYADSATSISGPLDCASMLNVAQVKSIPVDVNFIAKAGWNVVNLKLHASVADILFGKAEGTLVNSTAGTGLSVWRTPNELLKQLGL